MVELMAAVVAGPRAASPATCGMRCATPTSRSSASARRRRQRQPGPDGSPAAGGEIGAGDRATRAPPHVFVFRSTLVPGTVEDVCGRSSSGHPARKKATDFHVCFQPEFLREGTSIRDYDEPPFTIVGATRMRRRRLLRRCSGTCRASSSSTSVRAAEMIKYGCNNFHALKITFANETARLCEALGVDAVRGDGPAVPGHAAEHLAGVPEAGLRLRRLVPAEGPARDAASRARCTTSSCRCSAASCVRIASHIDMAIAKVLASGKRRIGMIGLSFKTGTDDLRESPLVCWPST